MREYEHEYYERTSKDREIKHIKMPTLYDDLDGMMKDYLESRELSYELAVSNGWFMSVQSGTPRVVIPCVNSAGFNYWQARAMDDHPIRYMSPTIPRKDSIVFLCPNNGIRNNTVVITEGPMDALAAAEFYPAIAIMGGVPSEEVLSFILKKTGELGLYKKILVPDIDNLIFISKFPSRDWPSLKTLVPTCKDLAATPKWERKLLLKNV